ncbi:MAG TPA: molybdopterin cofactor-binding domain-containing protein, partial [Blastocatellia bacterium]|nr:molybdopterin cofactor-binding domain-containing protein [Blastocatellia bacterium]
MSKPFIDDSIEVERYELFAEPEYDFNFDVARRDFFKLLGGGLVMVFVLPAFAQESGRQGGRRAEGESTPKEIGGWLHIGEDGSVTVYTGKVEFGQNIRTSLSQAVAEELRVQISSIRMTMGDTDLTP